MSTNQSRILGRRLATASVITAAVAAAAFALPNIINGDGPVRE